jgi:hypothetical protein
MVTPYGVYVLSVLAERMLRGDDYTQPLEGDILNRFVEATLPTAAETFTCTARPWHDLPSSYDSVPSTSPY